MSNTQNNDYYGSTTSDINDWANISWSKIENYVYKLQKRIYRAENEKNSYKVRNLQRLLIHSDSALLLAIKRVTQTNKCIFFIGQIKELLREVYCIRY